MPDKHGVPLVFDAARKQLNITVVVEPPFKPLRFRHAWADAPQCMLFASVCICALVEPVLLLGSPFTQPRGFFVVARMNLPVMPSVRTLCDRTPPCLRINALARWPTPSAHEHRHCTTLAPSLHTVNGSFLFSFFSSPGPVLTTHRPHLILRPILLVRVPVAGHRQRHHYHAHPAVQRYHPRGRSCA